ncbi:MAG: glycosyltransferase family 39 protein [Chloroflexi bacterium]|nr:glycosyltransferase family 39 protein [Chloroflexota bacterium]
MTSPSSEPSIDRYDRRRLELVAIGAVVVLAAFLRLYRLDQLPPGLHYDEAFNAVEARRVIAGTERPIFFTENYTEEPMRIYATALAFVFFGDSTWSLRLVSAIAGILNVAALYLLARALFRSRWTAVLAAFVLAILYWHVNFSRLGMEPILTPLMMTLSLAFLWRGLRQGEAVDGAATSAQATEDTPTTPKSSRFRIVQRIADLSAEGSVDWALAGIFLGATQYTYKAALFVPVLVAAFIGIEITVNRGFWTRYRKGIVTCAAAAVLVFAPLGLYFVTHSSEFIERPGTVSIASAGPSALAENAMKVAGMFFVAGDDNPRSNLPGRPALDPFLAVCFTAGLVLCLARIRRTDARFMLTALVVMSLPSALTDFAPHFGRDIGVTAVVPLIAASGMAAIARAAGGRNGRWLKLGIGGVLAAGLVTSAYSTIHDYFDVWGASPGMYESFDVGYLSLADQMRAEPTGEPLYLTPVEQDHYTIQYGLDGRAVESFDGRKVLVLPPAGVDAAYGIVTRQDPSTLSRLARLFPNGQSIATISDYGGQPYATLFRSRGSALLAPQYRVGARLGNEIELIGYDSERKADSLALTVYWKSLVATNADYTVFVHLIGGQNPRTESPVWAQQDSQPGGGTFATYRWQPGETVVDEYALTIPADTPGGEYQVEIGMYVLKTGARVPVTDANGAPRENNRVLLERITQP